MPRRFSARLSETWLKAAVVGSLWASFEIIIGSFLHNMRVPFAGTILSFASVGLVIAFIQVWKDRGLVWRAGLVAALLKSISPSAIILGPMVGIFSEAVIIEFFLVLLGRNLPAYLLGGAFAVLSALIHKVVSLLVIYGFDLLVIVEQLYRYIIRQLGMAEGEPMLLIGIITAAYGVVGMLAAVLGYLGGRKALTMEVSAGGISPGKGKSLFGQAYVRHSSPWYLIFHLVCIVLCLYLINTLPIWFSAFPALGYAAFCLYGYKGSMRSFRKPSFWIWFMAITLLAAIFWNGLSKGNLWDLEGLLVGLKMNLRAVVILTGFAALSQELRNPVVRTVLYHNGFASVYHAVTLAFSVLPGIVGSLPGMKKLLASPVATLALVVRQASSVYPALQEEIAGQNRVVVITGEIQQGKTTFLKILLEELARHGVRTRGLLARGVHDDSGRIGYDLENISTGETCEYIRNTPSEGWYRHGKYFFSPEGLAFGRKILQAINDENTDLAVVDEVGPVEMKGRGWASDIERLVDSTRLPQLWVVRKQLVKKAIRYWNIGEVLVVDIGVDDHQATIIGLLDFVKGAKD